MRTILIIILNFPKRPLIYKEKIQYSRNFSSPIKFYTQNYQHNHQHNSININTIIQTAMKKNSEQPKKHTLHQVKSLQHIHFQRPEDPPTKKQLIKTKSKKKKFTAGLQSHPYNGSAQLHEKYLSGNTLQVNMTDMEKLKHLEEGYRTCLRIDDGETKNNIKWLVPKSLNIHSFTTFADCLKDEDFDDVVNLSINLLHFVCKKRIFRDQDFDFIYQALETKFPNRQTEILQTMTDVLRVLDS